ncbi:heterokaryon incompatibility protein-domain-containing protein [Paraphoma chrysanthemicola]|uniref:Heterokaryon incompatibility protein-domain-containing protein n=1 Tax=Paraphoma chrysanthemicola TaxID=798071 RepID=A0A8K0R695_9PLEO|nr:heterokaryon incompatibility protein-domain-containing protein [Paraphoma chrysanthemicola]
MSNISAKEQTPIPQISMATGQISLENRESTICEGCRHFKTRLFDPSPFERVSFTIHKNFAELSLCADTVCDLCKYIRRQLCYHSSNYETYTYSDDDFQDVHKSITVSLYVFNYKKSPDSHTNIETRGWQFFLGGWPGPSNNEASKRWVKDRSINRRYIGDDLSLHRLLTVSQAWLTTCIAEHRKCEPQAGKEYTFRPTRLLAVGQTGQHSIRLVLSKDLSENKKIDYTALSYCWGNAMNAACTTAENLPERLVEISLSSLPKTLQDAVDITRALHVEYLWVDALCILQVKEGDNKDWEREVVTMGKVYKHSLVTIAASGATDSSVGCYHRREASRWPVQSYHLFDENREPGPNNPVIMEPTLPNWNVAVEHSALSKRGWVLQERMLASRTLFWTPDGLFWGCTELNASECQPELLYSNRKYPLLHELVKSVADGSSWRSRDEQKEWVNVVEEYSQKSLTVLTDKLPAVAGLGTEVSKLTGKEFLNGIWKNNIVKELAWVADFSVLGRDDVVSPQVARIRGLPTWLWASVHQKLHFKPGRHGSSCKELVTILSIDSNQMRVRSRLGSINVTKATYKVALSYEVVYHPTQCTFRPVRNATEENLYSDENEFAVVDTIEDTLPGYGGTMRCVQWIEWEDDMRPTRREQGSNSPSYHRVTGAIILSPVDEGNGVYRRIGWLEVVDDRFFEEELKSISLV